MTWEPCHVAVIAGLLTRVTQTCWEWDCHPALVQVTSWSSSQGYIVVIGLTNSAFKAVLPSLQPILHPTQSTCVKWMHDSKIIQKYGQSVGLSFHSLCHFRRCVTASLYHNYILSQNDTHVNLCFDTGFSFPKSCFSKSLYCETKYVLYHTICENYTSIYDQAQGDIYHCAKSKKRQLGIFPFFWMLLQNLLHGLINYFLQATITLWLNPFIPRKSRCVGS